jgi:hypothetical protein
MRRFRFGNHVVAVTELATGPGCGELQGLVERRGSAQGDLHSSGCAVEEQPSDVPTVSDAGRTGEPGRDLYDGHRVVVDGCADIVGSRLHRHVLLAR